MNPIEFKTLLEARREVRAWKLSFFLVTFSAIAFAYLNWVLTDKYTSCQGQYQTLKNKLERLVNTPLNKIPDMEVQLLFIEGKEI